jgi:hypothetical protein
VDQVAAQVVQALAEVQEVQVLAVAREVLAPAVIQKAQVPEIIHKTQVRTIIQIILLIITIIQTADPVTITIMEMATNQAIIQAVMEMAAAQAIPACQETPMHQKEADLLILSMIREHLHLPSLQD